MSSNSDAAFWLFSHDPNRDPKAERSGKRRRGTDGIIRPSPAGGCGLHGLADDAADGVGGGAPHPLRGVGVGAEGKARVIVAQCAGQRLDVHAVLEGQRGEGVSEVMKAYVFRTDCLQYLFVGVAEGVRVEHGAGLGRHEQVGTVWVLCALLYQQLHRPLRNGQLADGVRRLGLADYQFTVDAVYLLADGDGHILHVQVRPQQGEELAPAQAGGQLQIEGRQQPAPFCFSQIRADLVLRKYLHLALFQLWQAAALSGVGEEQPLRYRLLQTVVQQRVDAPYHAGAETLVLQLDVGIPLDEAGFLQVVVEFLDLDGGQLFQRRVAQLGDDVVVDVVEVVVLGFLSQARLGVDLIPQLDPRAQRVGFCAAHVQFFGFRDGLLELFLGFCLRLGEDAFVDGFAGGGIAACGVAALPAAVFPLAVMTIGGRYDCQNETYHYEIELAWQAYCELIGL